jgi:hypothetical protein
VAIATGATVHCADGSGETPRAHRAIAGLQVEAPAERCSDHRLVPGGCQGQAGEAGGSHVICCNRDALVMWCSQTTHWCPVRM